MTNRSRPGSRKRIEPQIGGISHTNEEPQLAEAEHKEVERTAKTNSNYRPPVAPGSPLKPLPELPAADSSIHSFWLISLFVQGLLIAACAYLYYEKTTTDISIQLLQQQLDNTLNKSTELEAQLSDTGQSLSKKEGALSTQLFSLNDRVEKATAKINQMTTDLKLSEKRAKTEVASMSDKLSVVNQTLQKDLVGYQGNLDQASEKIQALEPLKDQVKGVQAGIGKLNKEMDALNITLVEKLNWQDSMNSLQASMDSIDLFRLQTNQSLDKIEGHVRDLNLRLKTIEGGTGVSSP